ncbi:MAG: hypothetical protein M0026_01265 [Nocardiopsaceae bacterium]|nr:hypothetical protein [Nocardiopsaceae bacterium]
MTHRRGNGLLADTYVPLIVLPTAMADLMLETLRESGIAAYAVPLEDGVVETVSGEPEEPTADHLYVDADERRAAEQILREKLPDLEEYTAEADGVEPAADAEKADTAGAAGGGSARAAATGDDDDVWADLVARFYNDTGASEQAVWPDAENLSSDERRKYGAAGDPDGPTGGPVGPGGDDGIRPGGRVVRPAADGGDDADHYIPPPPPPLPRGDLTSRLSWAGLFGGPVVLLGSMFLGVSPPGWLAFCAVAAFIAGFVVLVVRMGDRPSGDNGPDDGAVV